MYKDEKYFFRTEARMGNIINLKKMMSAAMFAAGLLVSMNSASAQQAEQEPLALLQLDVDGNGSSGNCGTVWRSDDSRQQLQE